MHADESTQRDLRLGSLRLVAAQALTFSYKLLNFLIAFRKKTTAETNPSNPPNANKILATTEFKLPE